MSKFSVMEKDRLMYISWLHIPTLNFSPWNEYTFFKVCYSCCNNNLLYFGSFLLKLKENVRTVYAGMYTSPVAWVWNQESSQRVVLQLLLADFLYLDTLLNHDMTLRVVYAKAVLSIVLFCGAQDQWP